MTPKPLNDFNTFVLDQLSALPDVTCKAMFGGHGLYQGAQFFGIVHQGRLYFKTDAESRAEYETAGMSMFQPNAKQRLHKYYEVPVSILEDAQALVRWAKRAVLAGAN